MQEFLSILKKIGGNLSADESFKESLVFAVWRQAAGADLARQTAPVAFENKRLTVASLNKAWQFQLKHLSPELLYKINARLGGSGVDFIEFIIDEESVRSFNNHAVQDKIKTNEEILKRIPADLISKANEIKDADLREKFLLAAGRSMELKTKRSFD